MQLVWTNWRDGSKQKWDFTDLYDAPEPYRLDQPRRLTWHECSVLQGFPPDFEPDGIGRWKYWQIGNARATGTDGEYPNRHRAGDGYKHR